jgi:hypothetical protein
MILNREQLVKRILLVDFENVQSVSLSELPADAHVLFILGAKQKSLPTELFRFQQRLGQRFDFVEITDMAHNAVDFCVAFYLGETLAKYPDTECVILSRDKKGFDPLVKHLLHDRGFVVRRVDRQSDAFPPIDPRTGQDPFAKLLGLLHKEKALPKKRKGWEGKIRSWFAKAPEVDRDALMERLFREGYVKEVNGQIILSKRQT